MKIGWSVIASRSASRRISRPLRKRRTHETGLKDLIRKGTRSAGAMVSCTVSAATLVARAAASVDAPYAQRSPLGNQRERKMPAAKPPLTRAKSRPDACASLPGSLRYASPSEAPDERKKRPTTSLETKALATTSGTAGTIATSALASSVTARVSSRTGLRPMESDSAPTSGASRISARAESDATVESSAVAFVAPSVLTRHDAGASATTATLRTNTAATGCSAFSGPGGAVAAAAATMEPLRSLTGVAASGVRRRSFGVKANGVSSAGVARARIRMDATITTGSQARVDGAGSDDAPAILDGELAPFSEPT